MNVDKKFMHLYYITKSYLITDHLYLYKKWYLLYKIGTYDLWPKYNISPARHKISVSQRIFSMNGGIARHMPYTLCLTMTTMHTHSKKLMYKVQLRITPWHFIRKCLKFLFILWTTSVQYCQIQNTFGLEMNCFLMINFKLVLILSNKMIMWISAFIK